LAEDSTDDDLVLLDLESPPRPLVVATALRPAARTRPLLAAIQPGPACGGSGGGGSGGAALVAQGAIAELGRLTALAAAWHGPVSLAVYVSRASSSAAAAGRARGNRDEGEDADVEEVLALVRKAAVEAETGGRCCVTVRDERHLLACTVGILTRQSLSCGLESFQAVKKNLWPAKPVVEVLVERSVPISLPACIRRAQLPAEKEEKGFGTEEQTGSLGHRHAVILKATDTQADTDMWT
jgi:hypothetical protein